MTQHFISPQSMVMLSLHQLSTDGAFGESHIHNLFTVHTREIIHVYCHSVGH